MKFVRDEKSLLCFLFPGNLVEFFCKFKKPSVAGFVLVYKIKMK